jgi:hypothetical protein
MFMEWMEEIREVKAFFLGIGVGQKGSAGVIFIIPLYIFFQILVIYV